MTTMYPLLFLGMLVFSVIGYFVWGDHWMVIASNHLGGLGIVGLVACLASFIARKKGRDHRKAFLLSLLIPVILGFAAVLLVWFLTETVYCGGGVVLLACILIPIILGLVPARKQCGPSFP